MTISKNIYNLLIINNLTQNNKQIKSNKYNNSIYVPVVNLQIIIQIQTQILVLILILIN